MSRESGQDRSQKTVAELLALHGGNVEGRRRHRRAAEDDDQPNGSEPRRRRASETGPQAIIDRVRGDSPPPPNGRRNGGRRALSDDEPGLIPPRPKPDPAPPRANGAPPSGAFPRPAPPASGAFPKPNVAPPEPEGFPRPPQESGSFQRPPDSGGFGSTRHTPPESGGFPLPSRRRPPAESGPLRRPPREAGGMPMPDPSDEPRPRVEGTRQVPQVRRPQPGSLSARLDGVDAPPEDGVEPGPPPGGMPSGAFPAPPRRPLRRRAARPAEPEPHTEQFRAINDNQPAVPPDAPPAGLSGWRRPQPPGPDATEVGVRPPIPDLPDGHPSGFNRVVPDEHLEATGFHDPFADDDVDDFGGAEPDGFGDYEYEDAPEQPAPAYADEPAEVEPESEASPARQWLSMAGQLALGVIGGAAVWLGFNWLWGQIPAAALVVALAVIVGLVFIVRKIRRADDIQTMVLAVLVGLVVTVSPAALLLLAR